MLVSWKLMRTFKVWMRLQNFLITEKYRKLRQEMERYKKLYLK